MKNIRICHFWSIIFILLCGLCASASPPKVIRTFPENGDMNVTPGPVKIRILFDQDMSRGGYSITGSGENYPRIIGKPQWTGKRSIIFAARLEPNHEYRFGINSLSYKNFKSVSGEPAEVYLVRFRTSGAGGEQGDKQEESEMDSRGDQQSGKSLTEKDNKLAIYEIKEALTKYYSYNDIKNVDWDALFSQNERKLLQAKTPDEFAEIAGILLARAKDKHIWLTVGEKHFSSYVNPVKPNINLKNLPRIIPNFRKLNDVIYTGRFSDGTGYIFIGTWSSKNEKVFVLLFDALRELVDAPGIIIDIRSNGGGSEDIAQKFAGCFVDKPVLYARHITVAPDMPSGFSDTKERRLEPNKAGPKYRGNIAVLIGPAVMSAGEGFVLMMKQAPGCVIVGLPTQGSSGNPKPHTLSNGVTVYLPSWKAMLPDGTFFEDKGIRPDFLVKMTEDIKQDPVIDAALKELKRQKMPPAKDSTAAGGT